MKKCGQPEELLDLSFFLEHELLKKKKSVCFLKNIYTKWEREREWVSEWASERKKGSVEISNSKNKNPIGVGIKSRIGTMFFKHSRGADVSAWLSPRYPPTIFSDFFCFYVNGSRESRKIIGWFPPQRFLLLCFVLFDESRIFCLFVLITLFHTLFSEDFLSRVSSRNFVFGTKRLDISWTTVALDWIRPNS